MNQLIQFSLENGDTILVELRLSNDDEMVPAGRGEHVIKHAQQTFESALSTIKPAAETIIKGCQGLSERPAEIQVAFGLKLTAEAGAIIAAASAEANYTVTLTWKKPS